MSHHPGSPPDAAPIISPETTTLHPNRHHIPPSPHISHISQNYNDNDDTGSSSYDNNYCNHNTSRQHCAGIIGEERCHMNHSAAERYQQPRTGALNSSSTTRQLLLQYGKTRPRRTALILLILVISACLTAAICLLLLSVNYSHQRASNSRTTIVPSISTTTTTSSSPYPPLQQLNQHDDDASDSSQNPSNSHTTFTISPLLNKTTIESLPSICCTPHAYNTSLRRHDSSSLLNDSSPGENAALCPSLCLLSPYCCQEHSVSSACAELAQRLFTPPAADSTHPFANDSHIKYPCETYCGNGICEEARESCETCAQDCGICDSQREQFCSRQSPLADKFPPNDPLFRSQWHLRNNGQTQSGRTATPGVDINILRVWEQGYTGKGVRVAVLDDGVQWRNPDLFCAYDAESSADLVGPSPLLPADSKSLNNRLHTQQSSSEKYTAVDPAYGTPQEPILWDAHGTSVAGLIAASYYNGKCGVGVAYRATITAIRLLGDNFSDWNAARALSWPNIDIYSNSWGPSDNGIVLNRYDLALSSIRNGIRNGRNGLGSIYVWAAGNGNYNQDDSNYDMLANSIYTISVAASDWDGVASSYSEPGANILVNAPSSSYMTSSDNTSRIAFSTIFTTDRNGASGYNFDGNSRDSSSDSACTGTFGGTSASCPIVSGVIALLLQANPLLTWRDVQWILVKSSTRNDRTHKEWNRNGAGMWFNRYYGFGRIDAEKALNLALAEPHVCTIHWHLTEHLSPDYAQVIPTQASQPLLYTFQTNQPLIVEHLVVTLTISDAHRGHIILVVQSPSGTTSVLAPGRPNDLSESFEDISFMSVEFWGEEASAGNWTIALSSVHQTGLVSDVELELFGSPVNCTLPVDPVDPVTPPEPSLPTLLWNRIKLVIIVSIFLLITLIVAITVLVEVAKMQIEATSQTQEEILKEMLEQEDSSESDFFDTSSTSSLSTISD